MVFQGKKENEKANRNVDSSIPKENQCLKAIIRDWNNLSPSEPKGAQAQ